MSKLILFQGDSITDCGRNRDRVSSMGDGYANLVKASLGMDFAGEYEFVNKGISGNRIVDLYARIKIDFINLKPDSPKIYYIWGHTYEFDIANTWDKIEEFLKMISGRDDIFYGTNEEVLLGAVSNCRK